MFWIIPTETDFIQNQCVHRMNAHTAILCCTELLKADAWSHMLCLWADLQQGRAKVLFFLSKVLKKITNGFFF